MRTGMVHTSLLLAWLFILIRAGSEESAASSPGAVAGFASACISDLRASTGRGTGGSNSSLGHGELSGKGLRFGRGPRRAADRCGLGGGTTMHCCVREGSGLCSGGGWPVAMSTCRTIFVTLSNNHKDLSKLAVGGERNNYQLA